MHEQELDRLAGTRLQLELQVNTLESANLNAETMAAMKKAADALKSIHGNLCVTFIHSMCRLVLKLIITTLYVDIVQWIKWTQQWHQ